MLVPLIRGFGEPIDGAQRAEPRNGRDQADLNARGLVNERGYFCRQVEDGSVDAHLNKRIDEDKLKHARIAQHGE